MSSPRKCATKMNSRLVGTSLPSWWSIPRSRALSQGERRTVIPGRHRQVALSLVLLATVIASLLAAPGPDGLLGAFLCALMSRSPSPTGAATSFQTN